MSLWTKVFGGSRKDRVDYYEEGITLSQQGKFPEALNSLRIALRGSPGDPLVMQQIAIVYTRMGMDDEAAKTYRHVLRKDGTTAGAHYGLAFLLLRQRNAEATVEAIGHLESFLEHRPPEPEASEHIRYAEQTLRLLRDSAGAADGGPDRDMPR